MSAARVGQLVRERRAHMGLSATLTSKRAGITRQGLSKIESGACGVSLSVAARLCYVLVIDPARMIGAAHEEGA